MTAAHTSLRSWLRHLAASDRLAAIRPGVALEHELAAIAKRLDGRQAALFPRPGGHSIPVVSGFMSRRSWIAEAMGVPEARLLQHFRAAAEKPLPWREVTSPSDFSRATASWVSLGRFSRQNSHACTPVATGRRISMKKQRLRRMK